MSDVVSKLWGFCHTLRHDGIDYGDYIEQITYLLFLKMDEERSELLNEPSVIPAQWRWDKLANKDGDALELQYRHMLENLGKEPGLIGVIFEGDGVMRKPHRGDVLAAHQQAGAVVNVLDVVGAEDPDGGLPAEGQVLHPVDRSELPNALANGECCSSSTTSSTYSEQRPS